MRRSLHSTSLGLALHSPTAQINVVPSQKYKNIYHYLFILILSVRNKKEEAKEEKLSADQMLKDTIANRDEIEKECAERLLEVSVKEEKVEFDLQANKHIKEINARKEKELNIRERQINDKYATLQRSINRLKK